LNEILYTILLDTNVTLGLRKNLIEELERYFISKKMSHFEPVINAIGTIPRHRFIPIGFESAAYEINPVLIDSDQTMSSPLTVALQTYFLNVQPQDKILEIGTGSGYQASVLSRMAKEIYTLERHRILHEKSSQIFRELKLNNIHTFLKDGFEGLPNRAPFNKIIITCAAPEVPQNLVKQLAPNGIMLVPLDNSDGSQTMIRILKSADESLYEESLGNYNFVPMLKGIQPD